MVPVPLSRLQPSRDEAIEDWPWLDQDVLRSSRSRQVCMTCHFFRHHPGPNCIPLLTCHLHQGLIAHGEHLTHRCCPASSPLADWRQSSWPVRGTDRPWLSPATTRGDDAGGDTKTEPPISPSHCQH